MFNILDSEAKYLDYTSFPKRVLASLIDSFIIGVVLTLPLFAMVAGGASKEALGIFIILIKIGVWIYEALMHSSSRQATLGKLALGIKVVDLQGQRLSFGRATVRYFGKWLSSLICGLIYLIAAFTPKNQALHDMIAGTVVIED